MRIFGIKITGKTIAGGALQAIAILSLPPVLNLLPVKAAAIVGAVGVVLEKVGVRDAIAKNGQDL